MTPFVTGWPCHIDRAFPTIDQVRCLARLDMNAASTVTRDWRRTQTMQAGPVAVQIPEPLAAAHGQALAALWLLAQELANDSMPPPERFLGIQLTPSQPS